MFGLALLERYLRCSRRSRCRDADRPGLPLQRTKYIWKRDARLREAGLFVPAVEPAGVRTAVRPGNPQSAGGAAAIPVETSHIHLGCFSRMYEKRKASSNDSTEPRAIDQGFHVPPFLLQQQQCSNSSFESGRHVHSKPVFSSSPSISQQQLRGESHGGRGSPGLGRLLGDPDSSEFCSNRVNRDS